jgi:hypothetical protein
MRGGVSVECFLYLCWSDYSELSTDELIEMIDDYSEEHNVEKVTELYHIISQRDDVESEFWIDALSGALWIADILDNVSIKQQLSIHDVILIPIDTFEKFIKREDVDIDMDGYECALKNLEDDGEIRKIELIMSSRFMINSE